MNIPNKEDVFIKLRRIRDYLQINNYSGMILGRNENFSWLSDGGNAKVISSSYESFGVFVITKDKFCLIAESMDGKRILEEELIGIDIEYIELKWFESTKLEKAISIVGKNPVSDLRLQNVTFKEKEIFNLHFPLTNGEIEKLTFLGKTVDEALYDVSLEMKIGMSDYEVEAMILYKLALKNIQCDVLMVGTDERIKKYRHPNPVGNKISNYVLLHPAAKYKGLHCNVTRSVYFGDVIPKEIKNVYDAVREIQAFCITSCKIGAYWKDIFEEQKKLYKTLGFTDQWQLHYPGGRTGYFVCEADLCKDENKKIIENEAYDFFITVDGAKVEELSINKNDSISILSNTGKFSSTNFVANGLTIKLPNIMQR